MNAESTREALDVASLAGDILLASGAEIFRVEETIDRIAAGVRRQIQRCRLY